MEGGAVCRKAKSWELTKLAQVRDEEKGPPSSITPLRYARTDFYSLVRRHIFVLQSRVELSQITPSDPATAIPYGDPPSVRAVASRDAGSQLSSTMPAITGLGIRVRS